MSNRSTVSAPESQQAQLAWTLALIATIWGLSDIGYYVALPAVGIQLRYGADPVPIALYYGLWVTIAVITFQHLYRGWSPFENRRAAWILVPLAFAGFALFAVYALPLLPPVRWGRPGEPPDLLLATPWYFLPKSIEILFQQLLIVAMVLALAAQQCRTRSMGICVALLFGGMHLLLAFSEVPWAYVIRFTLAATLFGFVFPYLILRVKNGFAYSYVTHWGYYAITVVMVHTISPHVT